MATSGVTTFSVNRDQLISGALRAAGAIAQGETPTATQVSEAAEALNMFVKELQADGMPLWALKQYSVPLTATNTFNIGTSQTINTPKPLKVIGAFLHNTSTDLDIPMVVLTREEYNRLGNKITPGQPIQVFYEPLINYGVLHVFPLPDSYSITNCTITLVYQRPFEDFVASTDTPDFPQEWYNAIKFGLAHLLAPEYGLPLQERQDLASRARELRATALGFGTEEGSVFFGVDKRDW